MKALGSKKYTRPHAQMSKGRVVLADGNPGNGDTLTGMPVKAMCYVPTTGRVYNTVDSGTTWTRIDG